MMKSSRKFSRRKLLLGGVAAGVVATGLYTRFVEPHWVDWVVLDMPVDHLPEQLAGATLVQLSDLHIGPQVSDEYLLDVFRRVQELSPQFIVYTGDFVSTGTELQTHAPRMMAQLPQGSLGTCGVLGNHDYGSRWTSDSTATQVIHMAEQAGVRILRNQRIQFAGLNIVGLDDLWARRFSPESAFADLDPQTPGLALVHNPDAVDQSGWSGYSGWILSGHTHGGQCKPPFLPPPMLPVRNRRYTSGEFDVAGGRRLYINRGVGHLLKVRFNARPEVTVFRLQRRGLS